MQRRERRRFGKPAKHGIVNFKNWLHAAYSHAAAQYRYRLSIYVSTARQYAEGAIWEQKHTDLMIDLMRTEPIPAIGKFPGEVSAADKEWFKTAVKPDWNRILQDYINELPNS